MKYLMIGLALLITLVVGDALLKVDRPAIPNKVIDLFHSNTVILSAFISREKRRGMGSGVWINEWYVLTACHVQKGVESSKKQAYSINYNGMEVFKLTPVVCDEENDIALYKADWANVNVKPIVIEWVTPRFGSEVYSAGYHHDLPLSPKVGYMGDVSYQAGAIRNYLSMSIGIGDSGSPLFNKQGELIGIILAIYSARMRTGENVQMSEVAFAATGYSIQRLIEENIDE